MSISINNHFDTLSKGKISLDIMLQPFKSWENVSTTVISIILILSIYDNIVIFAINPQLRQRNILGNLKSNKKINHVIPLLVVTQSLSTNNINDLHSHDIIKFYTYIPNIEDTSSSKLNGKQNKMNIKTFKPIIFASTSDFYCLSFSLCLYSTRHLDFDDSVWHYQSNWRYVRYFGSIKWRKSKKKWKLHTVTLLFMCVSICGNQEQ